ncbi:hypothetical protein KC351_g84 [Hortaea werneckii]|nr:hypothetical protein KC351_g84 [Hortaea werneckii]
MQRWIPPLTARHKWAMLDCWTANRLRRLLRTSILLPPRLARLARDPPGDSSPPSTLVAQRTTGVTCRQVYDTLMNALESFSELLWTGAGTRQAALSTWPLKQMTLYLGCGSEMKR